MITEFEKEVLQTEEDLCRALDRLFRLHINKDGLGRQLNQSLLKMEEALMWIKKYKVIMEKDGIKDYKDA